MKKSFFILILLVVFACNRKSSAGHYSKVEIYCWCFLFDKEFEKKSRQTSLEGESCSPTSSVPPGALIVPERLFYSTENPETIHSLEKIILDKKNSVIKSDRPYPDTRFLILFRQDDKAADTLVTEFGLDNKSFFYNSKSIYKYNFEIMDSLIAILGMKKIACSVK